MKRRHFLQLGLGAATAMPLQRALARDAKSGFADQPARSLEGAEMILRGRDVQALAASISGGVLLPGAEGYDAARMMWNGTFDRRPALIARCRNASDVRHAVDFARESRILTAVRAGGHSQSGKSVCNSGLVIDVSPMQGVRVDPQRKIAYLKSGSLLGLLDAETSKYSLVTTAGTVSHTGAAGLTLGGGFGRVGRRFGLTCDNVRAVEIVTANGRKRRASAQQNADLYWGVRGGGGNFGVVTEFEYQLHDMDPVILGGAIIWPVEQLRDVLNFHAGFLQTLPDEMNVDLFVTTIPNGPRVVGIEACWGADRQRGEAVLAPLITLGKPMVNRIGPMRYVDLQRSLDAVNPHGARHYAKSGFLPQLNEQVLDTLVSAIAADSTGRLHVVLQATGGAINRVPVAATAFPNRNAAVWLMLFADSPAPQADAECRAIVRAAWKPIEPLTSGYYTNAIVDDETEAQLRANFGANYDRMAVIKAKYDPLNLFRLNANVLPRAS